jgi:TraY domain
MIMDKDHLGTYISLKLPTRINKDLTAAARRSGRSKVSEAIMRLGDHLENFPDIATAGRRFREDGNKG